jgi:three-Cys-motif partner protein
MATSGDSWYLGREQSLIKHIVLEKYLERFAVITGSWCDGIIYIDGFSGPWNVQSESLDDASFSIALRQLRQAREVVRKASNRHLHIKCIFLEKQPEAFRRLKKFADEQKDVEVIPLNIAFEDAIPELLRRVREAGRGFFPFIFIDPTGWKGFAIKTITPLLELTPSEVLINFMTGFIIRFAEDSRIGIDASFQELFGDSSFREQLKELDGHAREDALVLEYARRIRRVGHFGHTPVAVVPHPTKDRTHFHLVYATRSIRGVQVFKDAERKALRQLGEIRANAKRREREKRTQQSEFLSGSDAPDEQYLKELVARYSGLAREHVQRHIRGKRHLPFDEVYGIAMQYPTVRVDLLRKWILEVADAELTGQSRTLMPNSEHWIKLRDGIGETGEFSFF